MKLSPALAALSASDKMELAKELCWAATIELRAAHQNTINGHTCQCGHRRDDHSLSTSINYTEGWCRRCTCRWFLMADPFSPQDGRPMVEREQ